MFLSKKTYHVSSTSAQFNIGRRKTLRNQHLKKKKHNSSLAARKVRGAKSFENMVNPISLCCCVYHSQIMFYKLLKLMGDF